MSNVIEFQMRNTWPVGASAYHRLAQKRVREFWRGFWIEFRRVNLTCEMSGMSTSIFGHAVDLGIESGAPISNLLVKFLDALKIVENPLPSARQSQGEEGNCSESADCGV